MVPFFVDVYVAWSKGVSGGKEALRAPQPGTFGSGVFGVGHGVNVCMSM